MNLTISCFRVFLFLLLIGSLRAASTPTATGQLEDLVCAAINCGHGTCKASNKTPIGYDCECDSGWKKPIVGALVFPACILPNCTIDLGCRAATPPQPPLPLSAPLPPQPFNLLDTCSLVWCGDGTCMTDGTDYMCKCNPGSANLMNSTDLPCLKPCAFGKDCSNLLFGPTLPQPPSPVTGTSNPAPPKKSESSELPNCSGIRQAQIILALTAILLIWV